MTVNRLKRNAFPGYEPQGPINEEWIRPYGIAFPLLVEFVANELLEQFVDRPVRREAARRDLLGRIGELLLEAGWNAAIGRANPVWYVRREEFRFERRPTDLRSRRAKFGEPATLIAEYEFLHRDFRERLPRTSSLKLEDAQFRSLTSDYPELGWQSASCSVGISPSVAAHVVLAARRGVRVSGVRQALTRARKHLRGQEKDHTTSK